MCIIVLTSKLPQCAHEDIGLYYILIFFSLHLRLLLFFSIESYYSHLSFLLLAIIDLLNSVRKWCLFRTQSHDYLVLNAIKIGDSSLVHESLNKCRKIWWIPIVPQLTLYARSSSPANIAGVILLCHFFFLNCRYLTIFIIYFIYLLLHYLILTYSLSHLIIW